MAFNWRNIFSLKRGSTQIPGARWFIPGAAGIHVSEDTAMTIAAYYRGLIYISSQIAKLPWDIKDTNNKIQEGPLSVLLSLCPNPEMSSFMFRLCMVQNAIHHGNAYAEIQRDVSNRPIALWPIASTDVDLVRSESGELFYRVMNGDYSGRDAYIPAADMYHLRNFHTKDGLVGQGLLAYGMETLGISKAADRMASGIFNNGGVPSGLLKHPGKLSPEAYTRLKESWAAQNGTRKSGGTSILEEGITYEAVTMDPDVLQFLESRKFGVIEIARFLGLPPTKLLDTESARYSNVENSNLEVVTDTLDAWAVNLEIEADIKLLNKRHSGRFTELDLRAVFRGDMKTRSEYYMKMMQASAITPNEVRIEEGRSPYAEGARFFIASNNLTPVDRIDDVLDAQIKKGETPPTPPADPADKEEADPADSELTKAAVRFLMK